MSLTQWVFGTKLTSYQIRRIDVNTMSVLRLVLAGYSPTFNIRHIMVDVDIHVRVVRMNG